MGTTVFAVVAAATSPVRGSALTLGFVLTVAFFSTDALPDPAWAGLLTALVAAGQLVDARVSLVTALCAGMLAGLWSVLLRVQGMPAALAVVTAAILPFTSASLSIRRRVFAPDILKDEALLIVLVLATATAVGPGVVEGWRSASALNLEPQVTVAQSVPGWTMVVVAGTVALGGLYSLWIRR